MTRTQLRATLDAAGYADAEIRDTVVIVPVRDDGMLYTDHSRAFMAAGIPVRWCGMNIPGFYVFTVKLAEATE